MPNNGACTLPAVAGIIVLLLPLSGSQPCKSTCKNHVRVCGQLEILFQLQTDNDVQGSTLQMPEGGMAQAVLTALDQIIASAIGGPPSS